MNKVGHTCGRFNKLLVIQQHEKCNLWMLGHYVPLWGNANAPDRGGRKNALPFTTTRALKNIRVKGNFIDKKINSRPL